MLEKYSGKVKLVMKQYPIGGHRFARPAALAALAAHRQGRFWEFHAGLFRNYRKMNEQTIVATARDLGLDMELFEKDRKGPAVRSNLDRDVAQANSIGVRGTPSIFINGRIVSQRSLEVFSSMIEEKLNR